MSNVFVVLAIVTIFIVRGVVAEKKRTEEARRKAAAQGATGHQPAYSPPARTSAPVARTSDSGAHPVKPVEWDAYGNPIKPSTRPAAAQRPAESASGSMVYTSPEGVGSQEGTSPYARPKAAQWSAYTPLAQAYDSDTTSKPSQRDAYGNPIKPSTRSAAAQRPAESASGSMVYISPEGVGSQEGMSSYARPKAPPATSGNQPSAQHHFRYALNRANARQALIYSEILGKPKALRR